MIKRLQVILLLLVPTLMCSAQRLKCVEIENYDHVDYDACYLQFPGEHHKFEALYRKMEHVRRGGEGTVNILHVGGSHVQAVIEGDTVTAYARLLHKGRTLHVWNVDIKNTAGELISNVRVTNYIIKQPKKK